MTDWPVMTIAECASNEPYATQIGPFGKALTPEAYRPSGVPLLRGVNVNSGRFHDDGFVFISEEDADRLSKFESFPGDVLLVHKGTLGQIGLMPTRRRYERYIMGNSMLRVRCDRTKLLPEYLHYWLRSPAGQHYLLSRVSQVGVPQIQRPLTTLREASLPVPPVLAQEEITSVLGALDDKIEQNRRTAQALERLAWEIYQAWFVDFEPVKAKAAGTTTFPSMAQPAFDALPTLFVDSDIGPVPEGWKVKTFSDILVLSYGKALKAEERRPGLIPVYGSNGQVGWHNEAVALGPGIIVGRKGNPGTVEWSNSAFFPIDTTFFVERRDDQSSLPLLYHQLSAAELKRLSTDSAVPGINRNMIYAESCVIPDASAIHAFDRIVYNLFDLHASLGRESRKLAEARDYLLPKLLSGHVRVEGAHG